MEDRRITVRELVNEIGVSIGSVHSILTEDLGMRRVNPNFLNTVITGDESWVYGYDPESKMQSSQWKYPTSPRPEKARQVRSNVKVMLAIFFDSHGVVHHE
ncbi:hypothetical protein B7P43_G06927 [Cryptotermes secundus]|uniref:Uncharacterized protein n=1 Tax=Cryptotermes secundus TaxID=105785 RepID=A0A2J7RNZ1_9NEOP|nr:hypothetical protein B7P43_G06927 [Cryptotermes secundus]